MPEQLDYAPTPRRRIRWRWIALALLFIGGSVLFWDRAALIAQAKLRWTVHACQSYSRPADSIAFEANPAQQSQLIANDASYRPYPHASSVPWGIQTGAYRPVAPWDAFPPAARTHPRSTKFPYFLPGSPAPVAIPLFVHERACKDHPTRLVVVELDPDGLRGYVIDAGLPWKTPTLVWQGPVRNLGENIYETLARGVNSFSSVGAPRAVIKPGETLQDAMDRTAREIYASRPPARIYFGQVAPNDSAKFTIRVGIFNTDLTFEGRLLPDDTIEIEGPLLNEVLKAIPEKR